jgi:enamine deaminase RidA (YjgF/YER057c/UK114 family)
MTPRRGGKLLYEGPVRGVDPESYREGVCLAVENALNAALAQLEPGEQLSGILSLTVYMAAAEGFTGHSAVADLASSFLRSSLPAGAAIGSRAAVGVLNLPGNALVEIQLVACV